MAGINIDADKTPLLRAHAASSRALSHSLQVEFGTGFLPPETDAQKKGAGDDFSKQRPKSVILARSADANRLDHALAVTAQFVGVCSMDWPDYLRDQAAKYRQLAEQTDDPVTKNELLELASVCEEVASNIEDHLIGG